MSEKIKFNRKEYNKRYYELHKEEILKKKKKEIFITEIGKTYCCRNCLKSHICEIPERFYKDFICCQCFRLELEKMVKNINATRLIELYKIRNNEIKKNIE